ncbi:thioredoxin [Aliidiomarina minuta]|uniref:Thioredoxin n=1 Tax=Aliidiomarina minuta TaxID=880057 RepID=A0A432W1E3_9GAMM|nr:thioredoxin family protein [Aliidiomarina minuta]RUO23017.1 thioredoxin [Aliidiomarina minuta]
MKYILSAIVGFCVVAASAIWFSTASASDTYLKNFKHSFTESAYEQAKEDNKLVLIDVYATWCPTCRRQQDVLNDYFAENPDSEVVVFEVDYDDQKEWVSYFQAPRQSTLALYRGDERLWFSVAQTNKSAIFEALNEHDAGGQ